MKKTEKTTTPEVDDSGKGKGEEQQLSTSNELEKGKLEGPDQAEGFDATAEAERRMASMEHNEIGQLLAKYDWTGGDLAKVRTDASADWRATFEASFVAACTEAGQAKTAARQAKKAAFNKIKPDVQQAALGLARARAQADIASGTAFAPLSPEAQAAQAGFAGGTHGQSAAAFATALEGKGSAEQKGLLDAEVKAGNATYQSDPLPTGHDQHTYHFADGSLIRLKPDGDDKNGPQPGFSVEVLKTGVVNLSGQDDVAFKVDAQARAVPKGPGDTANPYQKNQGYQIQQYNAYEETIMAAGHRHASGA